MSNKYPYLVIARIPEYIEPIDRGVRYEDPLDAKLQESGLGEVTGGGSQLDDDLKIRSVELEILLGNLDSAISLCTSTLEECGAPKGSQIVYGEYPNEKRIDFGRTDGIALILDGVSLPDKVYEKFGLQELLDALKPILDSRVCEFHGCTSLNETTEIYLYGPSANQILESIAPIQATFPLCQNSRTRRIDTR